MEIKKEKKTFFVFLFKWGYKKDCRDSDIFDVCLFAMKNGLSNRKYSIWINCYARSVVRATHTFKCIIQRTPTWLEHK